MVGVPQSSVAAPTAAYAIASVGVELQGKIISEFAQPLVNTGFTLSL